MGSAKDEKEIANVQARHVFAYCHDSVGIGHLNRTLAICQRVAKAHPVSSFLLATGTPYVPLFRNVPRVDYIKLPALTKVDNRTYRGKYLTVSSKRIMRCREALLMNAVEHSAPGIVLIDKAPLGVCGELLPTLRWLRENRPETRVVFGMRDIEDDPESTIEQWDRLGVQEVIEECFDEVWVYGMRTVFDVATEYNLSAAIQDKLRFMGYIVRDYCDHATASVAPSDGVLVTVGGGTDGELLLRSYLKDAAGRLSRMGIPSTLVGGPDLPDATATSLRELARGIPGVEWIGFEPCMNCRIRDARLVVSMGGYNTLCQVARSRKPALVLPRTKPRLEQMMRASLWAKRGAVEVLDPEALSPQKLADEVVRMLLKGAPTTTPDLDLDGLDRVAERFDTIWHGEGHRAASISV